MASLVVDSMFVELGFDVKNLLNGAKQANEIYNRQREEARKRAKEEEERGRAAEQTARKIRDSIIGLYAAVTAGKGLKEFVLDTIAADSALGRFAHTLDANVGKLAVWRGAATTVGGTAEATTNTIRGLVDQFQQFSITGQSSVIPWFRALGVQIADAHGKMRPFDAILRDLHKQFIGMDPARAQFFANQLGIDQGTFNLLMLPDKQFNQTLADQAKYAPTQADIKAAYEMQQQLAHLDLVSSRLGRTLLTQLAPALVALGQALSRVGDWLQAHPAVLTSIAAGLAAIGTAITVGLGASVIGTAVTGLAALGDAFVAFGAVLLGTPIGWIIAGIAAISVAGYELINHWTQIKNWWQDLWSGMHSAVVGPTVTSKAFDTGFRTVSGGTVMAGGSYAPVPAAGNRLLNTIAGSESTGYNELYGGGHFSSYADHPNTPVLIQKGPNRGKYSTAAGRYQMLYSTWLEAKKALGLKDFSPESQDKAAWWLAQRDYRKRTGRDLLADLNSGDPGVLAQVGVALSGTWTSLPGGLEQGQSAGQFVNSLNSASTASIASNRSHTVNNDITIENIEINTKATDANGIARDLGSAINRQTPAAQADYGHA